MKGILFLIASLVMGLSSIGQHCPWDCAGMIRLQTGISKADFYKMKPVLVDESMQEVIDTVYGTGADTYDLCEFLYYNDFMKYRKGRINLHHSYQYDTVYHFARGKYLVKYNYCKYRDRKLFLRYQEPNSNAVIYHYLEIPANKRIHLHDYNTALTQDDTAGLVKSTQSSVLIVDCKTLGLQSKDCR